MRKNFYEILDDMDFDVAKEYKNLIHLFMVENSVWVYLNGEPVSKYIDVDYFRKLPFRGTFTSLSELMNTIPIKRASNELDDLLLLCEFLYAVLDKKYIKLENRDSLTKQANVIRSNILSILEKINYELVSLPEYEDRKIIVSKNPATVLASEVVEDTSVVINLFEYNHYAIKGHLDEKRKILNAIASYIEPMLKNKELKDTSYKKLESNLGFLLNKFHVRHNNKEGTNAQEYITSINDDKLEEWYDKIYSTALMYIIAREQVTTENKLDELKKNYTWKN